MSKEVALHDAKNGLSALIAQIESTGESVIITRHGKAAARLAPIAREDRSAARKAIARLLIDRLDQDERAGTGPSWQELKSEMDADRP